MELSEEIECLKAIFSGPQEFETLYFDQSTAILKFKLSLNDDSSLRDYVEITAEIPSTYPERVPIVSLNSAELNKIQKSLIEQEVKKYAESLCGSPMMMDVVLWIKNNISMYYRKTSSEEVRKISSKKDAWMCILQIDHMRSKAKYVKTLTTWTVELNVHGVLIFCCRCILLLLQGCRKSVKDYLIRLRTVCVDVDSSGKNCKEKMLKVLYEEAHLKCFSSFCIKELESLQELELYFSDMGLADIYKDYVQCIIKR